MNLRDQNPCEHSERTCAYALRALTASEHGAAEAHIATCADCRHELETLRPLIESFAAWPTDVVSPSPALQARLARRLAEDGRPPIVPAPSWSEPAWEQVADGIECKLLATDRERHRVSMLVRLAPGARYPAHSHAEGEELHLLDGELWIDQRKLFPGEYYTAVGGTGDENVWSETGCTCFLTTSTRDVLR